MKKLFLLLAVACTVFVLASCDNTKSEIRFELNLTGNVADTTAHLTGDFNVNVTNIVVDKELSLQMRKAANQNEVKLLNESPATNVWLDEYIQKNVISQFASTTGYTIVVKGLIHESKTGITLTVNKTFTNQ